MMFWIVGSEILGVDAREQPADRPVFADEGEDEEARREEHDDAVEESPYDVLEHLFLASSDLMVRGSPAPANGGGGTGSCRQCACYARPGRS